MPNTPQFPGGYVEEASSGVHTITGVPTSVTAFIGIAPSGPVDKPVDIASFADYERHFGGLWLHGTMGFAVRDFFINGGTHAVIVRIFGAAAMQAVGDGDPLEASDFIGDEAGRRGLYALEKLFTTDGIFNLLCIPPYTTEGDVEAGVIGAAAAYCEKRRAMLILDPRAAWAGADGVDKARIALSTDPDGIGTRSRNAALYFPRLEMPNPLRDGQVETFAPCGAVAGVIARIDTQHGVWKSPAGVDAGLVGLSALSVPMTDEENGLLNPLGINCLRAFAGVGRIVWGARTLRGADTFADEYKYIAVRRTALHIEESLSRGMAWSVFEPNDEPLWAQLRLSVGAFMQGLFRQGAFQGASPRDAYFVRCDATTTTQHDIALGIVNVDVGFAPLKPAEFVVTRVRVAGRIER